jgi:hypothetical protein
MVGGGNQSGTVAGDGSYNGTTNSNAVAVYRVIQTYVIEAETYAYVVEERLKWRWSKPANVTVNAPVRFAVEKRKLWILDDDGKEHETQIVKRVLREPTPGKGAARQDSKSRYVLCEHEGVTPSSTREILPDPWKI